jgi:hypothetical protein
MNTKTRPRVSFYFAFYGDSFDPTEITRRLGIEPTKSFRTGDSIRLRSVLRTTDGWIFEIPPRETFDIEGMLRELQQHINVPPAVVKQTCQELKLEVAIECAVLQPVLLSTPDLSFPADFLGWASDLGASIDLDFILIDGDDGGDSD